MLQCFFDANGVTDEAIFLTVVGASTYKLLSNLTAPAKPQDTDLGTLGVLLRSCSIRHSAEV